MTEAKNTVEEIDNEAGSGEDSPVIQALRSQIKQLQTDLKGASKAAENAVDQARAQVAREQSASKIVSDLGFPKLAPLVVSQVEGDLTEDSVKSFLDGLGLLAGGEDNPGDSASPPEAVEGVARLGQAVAEAARGSGSQSVIDRLNAAKSVEEIERIAKEAGFAQS